MKTTMVKSLQNFQHSNMLRTAQEKGFMNKFFIHALQLVFLFMLVFATVSTFAQTPTAQPIKSTEPGKLEFVKQNLVYNSGKVYLNWIATTNAPDCIYVIERSENGSEYEPVGLKEGISSPLELLYSWVDSKPNQGQVHYRIKQIDEQGMLMAQADSQTINTVEGNPLFLEKGTKMVSVK